MSSTTICITDTSVIPFPILDSPYTQTSNTAAGPLPHIPCRSPRLHPPLSISDTSSSDSNTSKSSDSIQGRSVAYLRYASASSSSSTPSDEIPLTIVPRSMRVAPHHRDGFALVTPASTPVKPRPDRRSFADTENRKQTPLRDTSDEDDTLQPFPMLKQAPFSKFGKLRLEGSTTKHVRHTSDSNVTLSREPVAVTPSTHLPPQTVRKKSGQPVKSSLKSARRPELHVVTDGSFAKSEPATPTLAKAVHFDSKLEHVKLFLAEQKPLAVSRDGSPTSDTSGDEFPSFIYGGGTRGNQQVEMLVPNMPSFPRNRENVALRELVLSQPQRAVIGNVRVRNIAYEKWLAVRFTLDRWQTTSEVTARYDRSIENGLFDLFTFTLRLDDIWSRIEAKTIFFALRYTVAGREYWDNNAGDNYQVRFVRGPPSHPSSAVNNNTSLRDLDMRLEVLAKARSSPISVTPYRLSRSFSADHQCSFAEPLSTRYNFASAYKTRSVGSASQPNHHQRTHTHPSGAVDTAGPVVTPRSNTLTTHETEQVKSTLRPQPQPLFLGSAQEAVDDTPASPAPSGAVPATPDAPSPSRPQDGRERHHRRGYTDKVMWGPPNVRRTPTGSPPKFDPTSKDTTAHFSRIWSYPLTTEEPGPMRESLQRPALKPPISIQTTRLGDGGSEESTPYDASRSSSSSTSDTPLFSPDPGCSRSDTSYKQFLDRFCFYTGGESLLPEVSGALSRSHSASGFEHYLLSHSPPQSFSSHMRDPLARFSHESSGSATPTAVHV